MGQCWRVPTVALLLSLFRTYVFVYVYIKTYVMRTERVEGLVLAC